MSRARDIANLLSTDSPLIDNAPDALNTLNELAAALGDDANFATTVTNSLAGKVSKSGDTITVTSASATPLVLKGASGQTADLINLQRNDATEVLAVDKDGNVTITNDSANQLTLFRTSSATARFNFASNDSLGNQTTFARISSLSPNTTDGAEEGALLFHTVNGGSVGERMRIDSSGNVGIGTTNPEYLTEVVGGTDATETVLLQVRSNFTTDSTATGIRLANSTNATAGNGAVEIVADRTNADSSGDADLVLRTTAGTSTSEVVRLTHDGYLRMASGSSGIQFGGDTAAANALDDYEEGTFTPEYEPSTGSFTSITYSGQSGNYTKIGELVRVTIALHTSSLDVTGASGEVRVTGLPFLSDGSHAISLGQTNNWGVSNPDAGDTANNTDYIRFRYRSSAAGSHASLSVSDMSTTSSNFRNLILVSAVYRTAV